MKKILSLIIVAMLSLGLVTFIARAQPPGTGPVLYAQGPDAPLFPSTKTLSYPFFPAIHPVWNISIMVANLSATMGLPVTTIAINVKSVDPTKVIVTNAYQGADFTAYGFNTFLNASWDPLLGDVQGLTAAQTTGVMISTPIEIFKIQVEGKAFTGPAGVVVDIYDQYAADTDANTLISGDCPYDHTAYLLQVITVIQPTAAFTWLPGVIYPSDVVTFDATASAGGFDGNSITNITAYQWDFGDGSPVANLTATPTHSYVLAGPYLVTLTIFTDISGSPDPAYVRTAAVSHLLVVYPKATGRDIDLFTDLWRYPGYGPIPDNLIGLKPGAANGSQVESYSPQDLVCLYAKLTYNGEPICYKEVEFEIDGPWNSFQNITIYRQAMTNGSGIAEICFRIPWADIPQHAEAITFGYWSILAKASVANVEISDWHFFLVHWMVQITQETVSPNPVFELGTLTVTVYVFNYALTPRNFTYTATLYDELNVPVGSAYLCVTNAPPGASGPYSVTINIPEWAYVGVGTVYKNIFTNLPWLCGTCWSPEQSENVIISPTDPHIPPF